MKITLPKFFQDLFKKRPKSAGVLINPNRDWKIILFSFCMVALALVCLSAYLFLKIDRGDIFKAEQKNESTSEVVNRELLDSTVERFEAKKAKLIEIETERHISADPSL